MTKNTLRPSYLATFVAMTLSFPLSASVVRSDVDYQYFRDFAENKGQFSVGASNITINSKDGVQIGMMMQNLPMPDLSPAMRNTGFATLIDPQYIVSVAHVTPGYYRTIEFGASGHNRDANHYSYKIVDRNDHARTEGGLHWDYHLPRLNKLVTEVAPAKASELGHNSSAYLENNRFTHFVRLGSGRQATRDTENTLTSVAPAYSYLTGGSPLPILDRKNQQWFDTSAGLYANKYGPLATYATPGDSGSPLFGYDNQAKEWLLVGVVNTYAGMGGNFNRYSIMRKDYHNEKFAEDIAGNIENERDQAIFNWSADANSSVVSQQNSEQRLTVSLADRSIKDNSAYPKGGANVIEVMLPQEEHGKTLNFSGKDATLVLKNHIDQGAGALNFNANVTVRPENDETWLGAGVVVAKDKRVNWQVKNPQGDRLSKLGAGTLHVNGRGENLGDISVGDGTVILDQQAESGKKQAFNKVGIVSGRATVVLNSADQLNPNNIYFGFRGGRLDLNGNSLAFERIQNSDDGANIVNHARKTANIMLAPRKLNEQDLRWGTWRSADGDIYEYVNNHRGKRKDYFRLLNNPTAYFPSNGQSNENWEFLSSDKEEAVKMVLEAKNAQHRFQTFNGFIGEMDARKYNGRINLNYDAYSDIPAENASSIVWAKNLTAGSDIYMFTHKQDGIRDYFTLKGDPNKPVPTNRQSNDDWEYLASSRHEAVNKVLARKNSAREQDKLNTLYMLSGGLNLNGDVTVKGGKFMLSGRPTPHAYDVINKQDVVYEDDWQNRQFKANTITANGWAQFYVGRNVSDVKANFGANDNAQLNLGFINGQTPSCFYSEYTGQTQCDLQAGVSAQTFANLPTTQIVGHTTLRGSSQLNLGKANLQGAIQADIGTQIRLAEGAIWTNTGDSTVGTVHLENGSNLTLNDKFNAGVPSRFNKLIINGNLNGVGRINYTANLANEQSDHVQVNGVAEGHFTLSVRNSGKEPTSISPVSLLTLKNTAQGQNINVSLENGYVDLGAYRYVLSNRNYDYRLYNPLKEAQERNTGLAEAVVLLDNAEKEAERQRQDIARLSEESRKAREAEQAEKQRVRTMQTALDSANAELNRLQQLVNSNARNPVNARQLQSQLDLARQRVANARTALTNANNGVKSSEEQLKVAEQAVVNAQNIANRLESSLATLRQNAQEAKVGLRVEVAKLCQENGSQCEQIQITEKDEELSLTQNNWVSKYANSALSELSAQVNSVLQIGRGIDRQLFSHSDKLHVWTSLEQQKTEHKSSLYRPYVQQTNLTQLGVEMPLENGISIGAVVSKNRANAQFDEGVNGQSDLLGASLYGKWRSENGLFVSFDGSLSKTKNRVNLLGENRFERQVSAVGVNFGQELEVVGMNVQPFIGMRYYHLSDERYDLDDVEVNSPNTRLTTYHAGVKVSKAFIAGSWTIEPSLVTDYEDANRKVFSVAVNDNSFAQRFGSHLKTTAEVALARSQWKLAINGGFLKGNEVQRQRFVGVKMQYGW